jgi:hypothetical protein
MIYCDVVLCDVVTGICFVVMSFAVMRSQVLNLSKFLLLQTAAPDAIVRLEYADLAHEKAVIGGIYFKHQHHSSMEDFLNHYIRACDGETRLLMQVRMHAEMRLVLISN